MKRTFIQIAVLTGLLIVTGFIVVVANQTVQLVALASQLAPWFGTLVLWALLTVYVLCALVPCYLILRLPKPLKPPGSEDDPEFPMHLERLKARLRRNTLLRSVPQNTREDVEASLQVLDTVAEDRIKRTAAQVFVSTAVSQNGTLDTYLVLTAQSKLVFEVARIYYQRPTLRDLVFLYSNVAATAFVAGELEDIDVAEQLEPVTGALVGSVIGAVPGLGAATTVITNSVLTGTANAYLTLRVGIITQHYCRSVVLPPRRSIRRFAAAQAAGLLGQIAVTGSTRVMAGIAGAGKDRVGAVLTAAGDGLSAAGLGIRDASRSTATAARDRLRGAAAAATAAGSGLLEKSVDVAERLRQRRQHDDEPPV